MNYAMHRKIAEGDAIDISKCQREGARYVLAEFVEGSDYCDAPADAWVWSIGRRKSDGVILASLTTDLYQNPEFECLWLR